MWRCAVVAAAREEPRSFPSALHQREVPCSPAGNRRARADRLERSAAFPPDTGPDGVPHQCADAGLLSALRGGGGIQLPESMVADPRAGVGLLLLPAHRHGREQLEMVRHLAGDRPGMLL